MLNKNDPLIGAVKQVMTQSDNERAAVKAVNEKFGVQDRKALPWQKQSEWDAAYKKVLSEGVSVLNEETQIDEVSKDLVQRYMKKAGDDVDKKVRAAQGVWEKKSIKGKQKHLDKASDGLKKASKRVASLDLAVNKFKKDGKAKVKATSKYVKEGDVDQQPSIESIHEEIAYNLYEQASYILENYGEEGLVQFFEALSEEEVAIINMHEDFWKGTNIGRGLSAAGRWLSGSGPNSGSGNGYSGAKETYKNTKPGGGYTGAVETHKNTSVSGTNTTNRPPGSPTGAASGVTTGPGSVTSRGTTTAPPKPTPNPSQNVNSPTPATRAAKSNRTKAASKTVSGSATMKSGLKAPGVKAVRKSPASRLQSRSQRDGLAMDSRNR